MDFLDRHKTFAQVVGEPLETFLTTHHYRLSGSGRRRRVRPGPEWRPMQCSHFRPQWETEEVSDPETPPMDDSFDPIEEAFEHWGWATPSGFRVGEVHSDVDALSVRTYNEFEGC